MPRVDYLGGGLHPLQQQMHLPKGWQATEDRLKYSKTRVRAMRYLDSTKAFSWASVRLRRRLSGSSLLKVTLYHSDWGGESCQEVKHTQVALVSMLVWGYAHFCDYFDHLCRWTNSVCAELVPHEPAEFSLNFTSRKRTKKWYSFSSWHGHGHGHGPIGITFYLRYIRYHYRCTLYY